MERRLLKDFQIGFVEGLLHEALQTEKEPKDVFSKIARAIGKRSSSRKSKKDWNALVRHETMKRDPIGTASEAIARKSRQSARKYIIENQGTSITSIDTDKLLDYNPNLSLVSPAARVAYAKFKLSKIKTEYNKREADGSETCSENTFNMSDSIEEERAKGKPVNTEKEKIAKEFQNVAFRTVPIVKDPREDLMTVIEKDRAQSIVENIKECYLEDSIETINEEEMPNTSILSKQQSTPKAGLWF